MISADCAGEGKRLGRDMHGVRRCELTRGPLLFVGVAYGMGGVLPDSRVRSAYLRGGEID